MTRGDLVFLDTNILLTATDTSRAEHEKARSVFLAALQAGIHLALSAQVIREYLAVATRPAAANGLGLTLTDALHNIDQFRRRSVLLEESESVTMKLLDLLHRYGTTGKQVHDANIVATMVTSGVSSLITRNTDDFSRFVDITCIDIEGFHRELAAKG